MRLLKSERAAQSTREEERAEIFRKVREIGERPTVRSMRAARLGSYRIVNGVVLEDGGDLLDHRVLVDEPPPPPTKSGVRKAVRK